MGERTIVKFGFVRGDKVLDVAQLDLGDDMSEAEARDAFDLALSARSTIAAQHDQIVKLHEMADSNAFARDILLCELGAAHARLADAGIPIPAIATEDVSAYREELEAILKRLPGPAPTLAVSARPATLRKVLRGADGKISALLDVELLADSTAARIVARQTERVLAEAGGE